MTEHVMGQRPPAVVQIAVDATAVDALVEIDGKIDGAECDGIEARWEFGRKLLEERRLNGGQKLPYGLLDELVEKTGKSRTELQYRAQFAAEYDSPEKMSHAWDIFRSWHEIREQGLGTRKPHVSNNSGENEWYTPAEYIAAATRVMGGIDLDPASHAIANEIVGATVYYTKTDDGLSRPWAGRVWMNPPYAKEFISSFAEKLADEYKAKNVSEACVLVNNATDTAWFVTMAQQASAISFPTSRIKFWHPDRTTAAPLQGQAVLYLGKNLKRFRSEFDQFGFTVLL